MFKNFEVDIEINNACLREKLAEQIMDIKSKSSAEITEILQKNIFDSFKFKTYQLLFHSVTPHEIFEIDFDDMFVLNEGKLGLIQNEKETHKLILEINKVERMISISVENRLDLEVPKLFNYIRANKISDSLSTAMNEVTPCKCSNQCSSNSKCCGRLDGRTFSYREDANGCVVLRDLTSDKSIIECGNSCDCDSYCINRLTQKIPTPKAFKLYKSERYGWTLKTDQLFPKG